MASHTGVGWVKTCPATGVNYASTIGLSDMTGLRTEYPCAPATRTRDIPYVWMNWRIRDPDWDNPNGLPIGGIIYGGRDSDTSVPVAEAYSWEHGVCTMGAMLESETTAATIGELRRDDIPDFRQFHFSPRC